jgi:two-component system sensor histidine kinase QseC
MEELVSHLLALSRADHGRVVVRSERVDVAQAIDRLLTGLEPRIVERRLSVSRHYASNAFIETDPVLLKSIIANLVENAVEYSPPESEVRIAFHREGAAFHLTVTNLARDLAEADLSNIFDRFWRKDLSRTGREHSGLGLALARSFAVVIGCKLEAEIIEKETLVMTLSSPSCPPGASTTGVKTSPESLIV